MLTLVSTNDIVYDIARVIAFVAREWFKAQPGDLLELAYIHILVSELEHLRRLNDHITLRMIFSVRTKAEVKLSFCSNFAVVGLFFTPLKLLLSC